MTTVSKNGRKAYERTMIDMLKDMWKDGWLGRVILALSVSTIILLMFIAGIVAYRMTDQLFVQIQHEKVTVLKHSHISPWVQTIIIGGKTPIISVIAHPERWVLTVRFDNDERSEFGTNRILWDNIKDGQRIEVEVQKGRISGHRNVTSITGVEK